MIKIGTSTKNQQAISLGSTNYSRVYVGSALVWQKVTTPTYAIGELALDGIVAYIYQPGDPGYDSEVQHGFVCSLADATPNIKWLSMTYTATGATDTSIGAGKANTILIVSVYGEPGIYAARIAYRFDAGLNWSLPSVNEQLELYNNKAAINAVANSPITDNRYWTSCETNSTNATFVDMANGSDGVDSKSGTYAVRPIRYF